MHTIGCGHWYDPSQLDISVEAVTFIVIIIAIVTYEMVPQSSAMGLAISTKIYAIGTRNIVILQYMDVLRLGMHVSLCVQKEGKMRTDEMELCNGLFCCQYSPSQLTCHDTYRRYRSVHNPTFCTIVNRIKKMIFSCHWNVTVN
jgi:hypothetical protein